MSKRIVSIVLCLALVVALAVPAFAAVSKTFFNKAVGSYRCVGTGSINVNVAKSTFKASEIPNQPIQPGETNTCEIWIMAYDTDNQESVVIRSGHTSVNATCTANLTIKDAYFTYSFNGEDLGRYLVFNN